MNLLKCEVMGCGESALYKCIRCLRRFCQQHFDFNKMKCHFCTTNHSGEGKDGAADNEGGAGGGLERK